MENPGSGCDLLYYDGAQLAKYTKLAGIPKFLEYFRAYSDPTIAPVDRSGTITFPLRMKSLFPLPHMRSFTKTYEEVCDERAQYLLKKAEKLDIPLCVFWSGGVDSTCVLVSLLKVATKAQKEHIVVLLSNESIFEYSMFYQKYLRGKVRLESAVLFSYLLGTNNLLVNGEHNDQLFGSDIIPKVMQRFGDSIVHGPYSRDVFHTFFTEKMNNNTETSKLYVQLFEKLVQVAPIKLKTNFDVFWWINFTCKWQTVYMRVLSFVAARNVPKITKSYVAKYYEPFFNSEDFQLWSMNNLDSRMGIEWRSYKWPAKDVIFDYTQDAEYRDNKLKRGSLHFLRVGQTTARFIDDEFKFHNNLPPESWYESENDFK